MTTAIAIDIPGFAFDEGEHRYTWRGRVLPGVTGILKRCGMVDDSFFTNEARDRGSAVHSLIHLWNEDDLDETSIDPRTQSYFDAYCRFLAETGYRPCLCEIALPHPSFGYAGRIDLIAERPADRRKTLIDFKTGKHQRWNDLQIALYDELLRANIQHLPLIETDVPLDWQVVELNSRGGYSMVQPPNQNHMRGMALNMLRCLKYCERI